MLRSAVLTVGAEVAQTHELEGISSLCALQALFDFAAGEHFQRVGIQASKEILACCIGIGIIKQIAVLANLSIHSGFCVHPVDGCALDLTAVSRIAAAGLGIVGCQNFHHIAVFVGDTAGALDQICTLQAALGGGCLCLLDLFVVRYIHHIAFDFP